MRKTRPLDHIRTISPWFTLQEAAEYYKISDESFRKDVAPKIGGRLIPGFSRELRFYREDLDNYLLKFSKMI